jgi:hypothetical protein
MQNSGLNTQRGRRRRNTTKNTNVLWGYAFYIGRKNARTHVSTEQFLKTPDENQ